MRDQLVRFERAQNEALFHLDQIKNSQSVYIGGNQVLTRLFTGQKIFLDATDGSVTPDLMFEGSLKPAATRLLTAVLRPSDTFIDVGANVGYFGLIAGTVITAQAGGRIEMIEANPRLAELIFKSINVTGLLYVASVANFAISDSDGEVELQVVRHLLANASVEDLETSFRTASQDTSTVPYQVSEKIVVPSMTLDHYAEAESLDKIDIVKINVQGHEEHAYAGMAKVIDENRTNLRVLFDYSLDRNGYSRGFLEQVRDDFKFVHAIDHRTGNLVEAVTVRDIDSAAGESPSVTLLAANEPAVPT